LLAYSRPLPDRQPDPRPAFAGLQHYLGHATLTNTVRYTAMSLGPFKDVWRD
jgi:hypothetical protein